MKFLCDGQGPDRQATRPVRDLDEILQNFINLTSAFWHFKG